MSHTATIDVPVRYRCSQCWVVGVKLWRPPNCENPLKCAQCLTDKPVDAEGYVDGQFGKSDQVGWYLPAVPTAEDPEAYWGYTSVPEDRVKWWRELPTYPPSIAAGSKPTLPPFPEYILGHAPSRAETGAVFEGVKAGNAYELPIGSEIVIGKRRWKLVSVHRFQPDLMQFEETTEGESDPLRGRFMYPSEVQEIIDAKMLRRRLDDAVERNADALEIASLIETLRGTPSHGDSVTICCVNEDAEDADRQHKVLCCGNWTRWAEDEFYGATLLEALRKAAQAKKKGGNA